MRHSWLRVGGQELQYVGDDLGIRRETGVLDAQFVGSASLLRYTSTSASGVVQVSYPCAIRVALHERDRSVAAHQHLT